MSEAVWLDSCSLSKLLRLIPDSPTLFHRKLKLFGAACCRRAVEGIGHPVFQDIITGCEQAADSPNVFRLLEELGRTARRHAEPTVYNEEVPDVSYLSRAVESLAAWPDSTEYIVACCRDALCGHDDFLSGRGEALFQADLLREIFGNPFRPVAVDPSWCTSNVLALAEGIYADRAFDGLPILADALEDAGCDAAELLAHLRGDGPHVRGCWALDLMLGKS